MIQDISPHTFQNTYISHAIIQPQSPLFITRAGELLIGQKEERLFFIPSHQDLMIGDKGEHLGEVFNSNRLRFIFHLDEMPCFFLEVSDEEAVFLQKKLTEKFSEKVSFTFQPRKFFRHALPKHLSFASVTALHLAEWYQNNAFCGACGKRTEHDIKERMLHCPHCGNMIFPRISPAVIVAIIHEGKILLTKYREGPTTNFALVAGFSEIGETLEETVAREVYEEVGIKVQNIRYYKSQPWGFTGTLLSGFFCDALEDTITLEEAELSFANWFSPEEIPVEFNDFSLTNEMITLFKEKKSPWN